MEILLRTTEKQLQSQSSSQRKGLPTERNEREKTVEFVKTELGTAGPMERGLNLEAERGGRGRTGWSSVAFTSHLYQQDRILPVCHHQPLRRQEARSLCV